MQRLLVRQQRLVSLQRLIVLWEGLLRLIKRLLWEYGRRCDLRFNLRRGRFEPCFIIFNFTTQKISQDRSNQTAYLPVLIHEEIMISQSTLPIPNTSISCDLVDTSRPSLQYLRLLFRLLLCGDLCDLKETCPKYAKHQIQRRCRVQSRPCNSKDQSRIPRIAKQRCPNRYGTLQEWISQGIELRIDGGEEVCATEGASAVVLARLRFTSQSLGISKHDIGWLQYTSVNQNKKYRCWT